MKKFLFRSFRNFQVTLNKRIDFARSRAFRSKILYRQSPNLLSLQFF